MERNEPRIYDDLTGDRVAVSSKRVTMIIDIDGKQEDFTLDFAPKTLDAMLTAFRDHDYAPLRRIFTGEPEPKETAKPKAKTPDDEPTAKEMREWARANGVEVSEKGRVPKEVKEKFIAAHR